MPWPPSRRRSQCATAWLSRGPAQLQTLQAGGPAALFPSWMEVKSQAFSPPSVGHTCTCTHHTHPHTDTDTHTRAHMYTRTHTHTHTLSASRKFLRSKITPGLGRAHTGVTTGLVVQAAHTPQVLADREEISKEETRRHPGGQESEAGN